MNHFLAVLTCQGRGASMSKPVPLWLFLMVWVQLMYLLTLIYYKIK